MCQSYEGERNFIISREQSACIEGFAAARAGKPSDFNPYKNLTDFEMKAWKHGWECWHQRIFPWVLEAEVRIEDRRSVREEFSKTGQLIADLEKFLPKV